MSMMPPRQQMQMQMAMVQAENPDQGDAGAITPGEEEGEPMG